ncbi:MAG: hypothetical protein ACK5NT_05245, partial [Pyrinomonadaceae bacterium]
KAIIILTDGIDSPERDKDREFLSKFSDLEMKTALDASKSNELNATLSRASSLGATIYPLALPSGDPSKLPDPFPIQVAMYTAARERLQILAQRTGGTLNAINRLEEMGRFYAEVAADIRSLYTIEYQPSNEKNDGKWREIRVEVRNPELIARTRPGYFPK